MTIASRITDYKERAEDLLLVGAPSLLTNALTFLRAPRLVYRGASATLPC